MEVSVTETIEDLVPGKVKILQAEAGYRYSIDPFLLVSFASVPDSASVVDLGSGSGVMPMLLSERSAAEKIIGLELQDSLVGRSRRSVAMNGLENKIEILQGDVRALPAVLSPDSFDVVITNPPYRTLATGRIAPVDERASARHELYGGIDDFLRAAAFLLKGKGRFFIIYLAERLAELLSAMSRHKLEPKRLRMVHSREGASAKMVMVEGRKNGNPGLSVEPPLVIYEREGQGYSEEILVLYENPGTQGE